MAGGLSHRRLRAPQEHGQSLLDPPASRWLSCLRSNRLRLAESDFDVAGRSARELRAAARAWLVQEASAHTRAYRDVQLATAPTSDTPILMTGHQPELFHGGVWFKNFVLDALARRCLAVPIHLIVDNDLVKNAAIRVPTGPINAVRSTHLPLDQHPLAIPYEERTVQDPDLFRSFPWRAADALGDWIRHPLLVDHWPAAMQSVERHRRLGLALAEFRHHVEATCGLQTLEVPISRLCDHESFARFVAWILIEADRVRGIHNHWLAEYRRANRVRSRTHPVPDLQRLDSWRESPLWIWQADDPLRRRLFVREWDGRLEISDLIDGQRCYRLGRSEDPDEVVEQLVALRRQGVKVRPRALLTTLFSRLFLCDLFIHGIGGAKYDELTDALLEQLTGHRAPSFLVATATLRLPLDYPRVDPAQITLLSQQIRHCRYQPERFLPASVVLRPEIQQWIKDKQMWCIQDPPRGHRRQRHVRLEAANRALWPHVQRVQRQLEEQLQQLREDQRAQAILSAREYAFCLFPEKFIHKTLRECLPESH